ncbi:NAD(P)-dependent oxidoreductase [Tardiphaga sp. 42S5]|uniref:NAD-dependent epimerase/dehydratase family protein n=1 Tax=Tardiphaga sp. 42S5 TaxID=1404799 RepID=UPI002A5AB9EE|nr:NAD(P)-dependent oxidoreductase [Tardiphaga sp. 42S5]WPO43890.1 NAD(P)-dependent oxidoreductase [Tardiphaga sp. 42S5]
MKILVFGGTGFVGLNIAEALLKRGHAVTLFDRAGLPPAAQRAFADYGDRLSVITGDVLDRTLIDSVIAPGFDAIVLGAAITAGAERDAADPESILQVNLMAQTPILMAAQRHGIKRVINLSSAGAYGASAFKYPLLDEELPCDPVSLYAITKFASEKVAARLAALWQTDFISVRLSAVFGPWERATGVRDTLSPLMQIFTAHAKQSAAILVRSGVRDWIYAPDVADAMTLLIEAPKTQHRLYNISTATPWSALEWGQQLAESHPGFVCRLASTGETPTIDLHSDSDRAPLSVARLAQEFGWRAKFGCTDSAADLTDWSARHSIG